MEDCDVTTDGFRWAYHKHIENDPEMEQFFQEELLKAEIARQVYDLRDESGLSQEALAEIVGTSASVIDRIEQSDYYEGDYLSIVLRIAAALSKRMDVRFRPITEEERVAGHGAAS